MKCIKRALNYSAFKTLNESYHANAANVKIKISPKSDKLIVNIILARTIFSGAGFSSSTYKQSYTIGNSVNPEENCIYWHLKHIIPRSISMNM